MQHFSIRIALIALLALVAGCTGNKSNEQGQGISSVQQGDADALNSERSRFESAQDPPVAAETHFAAGQVAEVRELPLVAIDQYKMALKLDPKHERAMYRLGVMQARAQLYPDAIATWKQYVVLTNGSAGAWGNLGFCYELAKNQAQAEASYRKGIAQDPKNKLCRVNYGLLLARTNRIGEAYENLRAVLTPAEVHYNLASVYEMQGKKDEARVNYAKALQLDPNLVEAEQRLAAIKE